MSRVRLVVAVVLCGAFAGCGPKDSTLSTPGGPPPAPTSPAGAGPTTAGESPTPPTAPAGKKTYSREELKSLLKPTGDVAKTGADVKALFGVPDRTREGMFGLVPIRVYIYNGLSVDKDGSGKVDFETRIPVQARNDFILWADIEFVP